MSQGYDVIGMQGGSLMVKGLWTVIVALRSIPNVTVT